MRGFTGCLRAPSLALLCLALAGCSFFNRPEPSLPPRQLSPVEAFIVSRTPGTPGATGMVSDPAFGDELRLVLEQEFLSAAGETCRRASLFSPRGETEVVIMCRGADGTWVMAPRVWGQSLPPAE